MGRIEERRVQRGAAPLAARAAQFNGIQCEGRIEGSQLHSVLLQTAARVAPKRARATGWTLSATDWRRSVRPCLFTQETKQQRCDSGGAQHERGTKDGQVCSRCRRNRRQFGETLDCFPGDGTRFNTTFAFYHARIRGLYRVCSLR